MPFGIIGRTGPGMRQWGLGISPQEWVLLGANLGRAIVTNGDFTAYVCDSAAMRPASQITFGKLVTVTIIVIIIIIPDKIKPLQYIFFTLCMQNSIRKKLKSVFPSFSCSNQQKTAY